MIIHNNMHLIDKHMSFVLVIKFTAKELNFYNLEKKFLILLKKSSLN
jgi:RNase P protein component